MGLAVSTPAATAKTTATRPEAAATASESAESTAGHMEIL
jgi:hypothetical protein